MADIATAYVNLQVSTRDVAKGVKREFGQVEREASKTGDVAGRSLMSGISGKAGLGGLGGVVTRAMGAATKAVAAGAVGVAAAAGAGMLKAVSMAGRAEQAIGGVESVFKKQADTIIKESGKAADAFGLSSTAYQELATRIGGTLKNKGIKDYTKWTTDMVALGGDLAATFGGDATEAVEALSSALRGESDPIERYNVTLSESAVAAELAASGQSKLEGSALEAAKTQARLKIIMEQTADAQGQAAREHDTYSATLDRVRAKATEAATELGDKLRPAAADLLGEFEKQIPALQEWAGKGVGYIQEFVEGLTGSGGKEELSEWGTKGAEFRDTLEDIGVWWNDNGDDVIADATALAEAMGAVADGAMKAYEWYNKITPPSPEEGHDYGLDKPQVWTRGEPQPRTIGDQKEWNEQWRKQYAENFPVLAEEGALADWLGLNATNNGLEEWSLKTQKQIETAADNWGAALRRKVEGFRVWAGLGPENSGLEEWSFRTQQDLETKADNFDATLRRKVENMRIWAGLGPEQSGLEEWSTRTQQGIEDAFTRSDERLQGWYDGADAKVKGWWEKIRTGGVDGANGLGEDADLRFGAMSTNADGHMSTLRDRVNTRLGEARDWGNSRLTEARDWWSTRMGEARDNGAWSMEDLRNRATSWLSTLRDEGADLAGQLRDRMGDAFGGIVDKFRQPVSDLIDFLNKHLVGGVNKIAAKVGLGESWLPLIPGVTVTRRTGVSAMADGGITSREPQIRDRPILWAEAGPEAYIPLDPAKRSRSLALWQEVGRQLGAHTLANGKVFPLPAGTYRQSQGAHSSNGSATGYDYAAPLGTPVMADADATVVTAADLGGRSYGKYVRLSNGSLYAHLSSILATVGQVVKAGQMIARVGFSGGVRPPGILGTHLHYEPNGAVGAAGAGVDVDGLFKSMLGDVAGKARGALGSSPWGSLLAGIPGTLASGALSKLREQSLAGFDRLTGGGASQWMPVVLEALKRVGQPASLAGAVLRQIQEESGGNPSARNNWDINARNGDPSVGLLQVIGSTFSRYRDRSLPNDRTDPLANITASLRYVLDRYGDISVFDRVKGYDSGGYLPTGLSTIYNGTGKPEPVFTSEQWDTLERGGGQAQVVLTLDEGRLRGLLRAEVRQMAREGEIVRAER